MYYVVQAVGTVVNVTIIVFAEAESRAGVYNNDITGTPTRLLHLGGSYDYRS
jgi:hypothetical protein